MNRRGELVADLRQHVYVIGERVKAADEALEALVQHGITYAADAVLLSPAAAAERADAHAGLEVAYREAVAKLLGTTTARVGFMRESLDDLERELAKDPPTPERPRSLWPSRGQI